MKENIIELVSKAKVLPILRSSDPKETVDTAKALIDAGIKTLEVNIENPKIYDAIKTISKDVSVCAGGIVTTMQAKAALESGAKILSSPIFQMHLLKFSKDRHIPLISSASTANEAYNVWKAWVPFVKIYPVTPLGGVLYIKDMLRQMPFLKVVPLGNVKLNEVQSYLDAGAISVGVGRDLYEGYSHNEITKRVKSVLERLNS
ncbi:MAG: bifunctional 4-hydroxy-2-oxoglutarate aldolase/2-dehydro-3-deoxy-phosphogluconate aldolase [Clostridiaceae bacterium]|jgi:2-dehydro-3-deoxyphosphogluconate aldolase / (4S)-4-hydroxy-2-oxoglutarate aldolase|nr:bifunctional 4-hydroxy-2-oxoglutarate aldolase/2-dehydro-3-deoxy-phosphogluconate aldolase [Clostridiaceae bacterium]